MSGFRTIENFRLVDGEKLDNLPNNTNSELSLKEDKSNKSTNINLGNSDVLYPSQNAVKEYVDAQVATATIPDATTTVKGKVKLAGDLSGTADLPTVPELLNKVDKTTTVNGKSLSNNVTLNTDDVGEGAGNKYDKTVTLTSGNDINITGSYPNFTIESTAKGHIIQDEGVDVNNRGKLNFKNGFVITDNAGNNSTDVGIEFEQIPNYSITNVNEDRQLDGGITSLNEVVDVLGTLIQDVENTAFIAGDGMKKATYDPANGSRQIAFKDQFISTNIARDGTGDYNCDGVADQIQIQQAIDYVNSQGGGDIFIKKGTYIFTDRITFDNHHNINIFAEKGVIFKQNTGDLGSTITFQGASSFIRINGIEFDNQQNTAFENGHILRIRESNNIIIENCIFRNCLKFATENGNDAIYINTSGTYPAGYGGIENITIQNNRFYDISRQGVSVIRGNNIKISGNYFNVRRSGVDVEPNSSDDYIGNIMITNNIVDGVRPLVGVYSVTTSSFVTSAFSGNGAGIELVISELFTIGKSIVISNNTLNGNNNAGQAIKCSFMEVATITGNTINNFGKTGGYCCIFSAISSGNFSNNSIYNFRGVGVKSYLDENIVIGNNTLRDGDQAFYFNNALIANNSISNVGNLTNLVFKCDAGTKNKLIGNTVQITNRTVAGIIDFARGATLRPSIFIDNLNVEVSGTGILIKFLEHTVNQGSEFIMKNSTIKSVEISNVNFLYFNYPNQNSLSYQSLILQNNNFINCSGRIGGQKLKEFIVTGNTFYNSGDNTTPGYCLHVSEVDSMLVASNRFTDERSVVGIYFIGVFGNFLTNGKQNRLIQGNIFYGITNAINAPTNVKLANNLNGDNLI